MRKISVMLIVFGMIFAIQSFANAAPCPIRGSKYTYKTYEEFGSIVIRQEFLVENVSDSEVHLSVNDFVMRKSGFNTVQPSRRGGGFSKTVKNPYYVESYYSLYPGDIIAVSLDYHTHDKTANGWKLCFNNYGKLIVLASINE